MKSALDVHQVLLATGVHHEVVRLPGPAGSADDLPRLLGVDRESCVAVRCYRVDARTPGPDAPLLAAVLVRAGDAPDEQELRRALGGSAVEPASPDEVSAHTDCAASLVCPIGLPELVVVLADSALADRDGRQGSYYCATGDSGTALAIPLADLLVQSRALVASLTPAAGLLPVAPLAAAAGPTRWLDSTRSAREAVPVGARVISFAGTLDDRAARRRGRPTRTAG